MRLYRLIAILLLIESRGQMKARDLARALETSERTVYRDVDELCKAGVPVTATTGPNGGIRFMNGYSAKLCNLRGEDAVSLYLSGSGLMSGAEGDSAELKIILSNLERFMPQEFQSDIRTARERFFFDEEPWWGERPVTACLAELRRAVWGLRKLQISYVKTDGHASLRTVRPYGLVLKSMQWYLVALCEDIDAVRTFKGDRIVKAEILDEKFTLPEVFDLEQYWKDGLAAFKEERRAAEKYPVRIRLRMADRWILDNMEIYDESTIGDHITAVVNMHKFDFAKNEALNVAWHAEILSPLEIREYVSQRIAGLSKQYVDNGQLAY